jgi:hypothetical protein
MLVVLVLVVLLCALPSSSRRSTRGGATIAPAAAPAVQGPVPWHVRSRGGGGLTAAAASDGGLAPTRLRHDVLAPGLEDEDDEGGAQRHAQEQAEVKLRAGEEAVGGGPACVVCCVLCVCAVRRWETRVGESRRVAFIGAPLI